MDSTTTLRPIHPIEARLAFGGDRDHAAIPGRIVGIDGDAGVVALANGWWVTVAIEDPRYFAALQRTDLTRYQGRELVVLVNPHYRLVGLAFGPADVPRRLAVRFGVQRLEDGSAVELPGDGEQPGWLLFRCEVDPILCLDNTAGSVH